MKVSFEHASGAAAVLIDCVKNEWAYSKTIKTAITYLTSCGYDAKTSQREVSLLFKSVMKNFA